MKIMERLKRRDLSEIKLSSANDVLEIKMEIELGDNEGDGQIATLNEYINGIDMPEYLKEASLRFVEAVYRALREGEYREKQVLCSSCTGACCSKFDEVRLTDEDKQNLLRRFGAEWMKANTYDYKGPSFTGYSGGMLYGDHEKGMATTHGCRQLGPDGCKIYEDRPSVCREFSAYGCSDWELDRRKLDLAAKGKRPLRVIK